MVTDQAVAQVMREMTTRVMWVTPAQALEWLRAKAPNRTISDGHVRFMAQQLKAGTWRTNGQPIILDRDGRVMDGQHRLTAIVEADTPMLALVVFNADWDTMATIDTGRARGASDVLSMGRVANAVSVASAARYLLAWQAGRLGYMRGDKERTSNADIQAIVTAHPGLVTSVKLACGGPRLLGGGMAGFLHYAFSLKDQALADNFIAGVAKGEGVVDGDPISMLRERLIRDAMNHAKKMTIPNKLALTIKTWNALRTGTDLKILRWRMGEEFPEIL